MYCGEDTILDFIWNLIMIMLVDEDTLVFIVFSDNTHVSTLI